MLAIGDESISLTAQELEEQMAHLAQLRASMMDRVPVEPPPIGKVMVDPRYAVRTESLTKTCLLRMRHDGYGWLDFELPPQEALHMKKMWIDIVHSLGLDPPEESYNGPERRKSRPH
ncbi:MAG: hypothetical protein V4632_17035 [Pseudomonadota bacterium]